MPVYAYKGLNSSGKEQKGLLDAESPKMLRATLKKQGHPHRRLPGGDEEGEGQESSRSRGSTEVDLGKYFQRVSVAELALVHPPARHAPEERHHAHSTRSPPSSIRSRTRKMKKAFRRDSNRPSTKAPSLADRDGAAPRRSSATSTSAWCEPGEASGALDKVLIRLAGLHRSAGPAHVEDHERDALPADHARRRRHSSPSSSSWWSSLRITKIFDSGESGAAASDEAPDLHGGLW